MKQKIIQVLGDLDFGRGHVSNAAEASGKGEAEARRVAAHRTCWQGVFGGYPDGPLPCVPNRGDDPCGVAHKEFCPEDRPNCTQKAVRWTAAQGRETYCPTLFECAYDQATCQYVGCAGDGGTELWTLVTDPTEGDYRQSVCSGG